MRKILLFVMVLVLLVSSVSAIEMRRTHDFASNEEKIYDFIGTEYRVRVLNILTGQQQANIEINGFDKKVSVAFPAVFEDLKITVENVTSTIIVLNLVWDKEDEDPDAKLSLTENFRKVITANGKQFTILPTKFDTVWIKATIDINGEELILSEGEKAYLKDGTLVKVADFRGTSLRTLNMEIWASDTPIDYVEEFVYDVEETFAKSEFKVIQIKGTRIGVMVEDITDERVSTITIDDQTIILDENEETTLENGITVKATHVSLKQPESVMLSMDFPDELVAEETFVVVERTIGSNQKDEFFSEDRTFTTRIHEMDSENWVTYVNINDENYSLKLGTEVDVGDVQVRLKIMNHEAHPPKAILVFTIPKKNQPKPVEPEEDDDVDETEDLDDVDDMEEDTNEIEDDLDDMEDNLNEIEDDLSLQEIPDPELPEENEFDETDGPLTLKESTVWTWNKIINFFKNLF